MKKDIKTYVAVMIAVTTLVLGIYIGYATQRSTGSEASFGRYDNNSKMNAIWGLVSRHYVDPLDADTVMDKVYSAILSTLDPHSSYLSCEMLRKSQESLRGNFEGVGIVLRVINDTVCVAQVIPDGPSQRAGVEAGDRILTVDGICVSGVGMPSDSVVNLLRGRRRSIADIKLLRLSDNSLRNYKVKRDVIASPSLTYSGMVNASTGYIHLGRFAETSHDEFCTAIKQLKSKGMKKLILDLRGNGGGLLSAAIDICDELLPGREMIVYTEGYHERRRNVHSSPGGLFCEGNLVVMIDEYSASASEIVAGAIQDNDRGVIVGRRSFGKGLVQQQFELPDQSAVLLTISRYYTPSGRCIQRPYNKGTDEYYNDFLDQIMNEYGGDTLLSQVTDSTPYFTTKGRTVYGGGGILPDHIVHYKSDPNIAYYNMLLSKAMIANFVVDYVSLNGKDLKKNYPTEEAFVTQYTLPPTTAEALYNYAEQKGLHRDNDGIRAYGKEIAARLKAEMAQMLYSNGAFYAVMLPFDNEIQEAMNL